MSEKKKAVVKLLTKELDSVYCYNCKYEGEECDDCNRKSMGWGLSKDTAKAYAELIDQIYE